MRKKVQVRGVGGLCEIETEGRLFGFKSGDIITHESRDGEWRSKRIIVEGFENGKLYGTVKGESGSLFARVPNGLILLERPGLSFKVGDRVRVKEKKRDFCDRTGEVIVIDPYQAGFLIEFHDWKGGHDAGSFRDANWFPKNKINEGVANCYFFYDGDLELCAGDESVEMPEEASGEERAGEKKIKEVIEVSEKMPGWFNDLVLCYQAKISHFFILSGNINDLQKNSKGEHISLYNYLIEIFEKRLLMFYSISAGLEFADKKMEEYFGSTYLSPSKPSKNDGDDSKSEAEKMKEEFKKARADMSVKARIGKTPAEILSLLEAVLRKNNSSENDMKKILVIDFADNLAPADMGGANAADRVNIETLLRWARDPRIRESGNIVILLCSQLGDLSAKLQNGASGVNIIHIPKPDEEMRTDRWKSLFERGGVKAADGLNEGVLGRLTNGLSLVQINDICAMSKLKQTVIDLSHIKKQKGKILSREFGDRINVKVPMWGFDYFGGKEKIKRHHLEIRDNIMSGMIRRVPMGILAAGPPGTGKTFFYECWAYECGFNFVSIVNPKNMYMGRSEENMKNILAAIDDLSPVIVVEDEADQSEPPRDGFDGSSGVNPALRKMKFEFCSDPRRRGKVIWIRVSNRPDLIDAAYKRKGRTDDFIPFLLPMNGEYVDIFKVMFSRYEIPTSIDNFKPYADMVEKKIYCAGSDVEWMVLEADKMANHDGAEVVGEKHLFQAIEDWEMPNEANEIDRQTIFSIKGSSKRLRPDNWAEQLELANERLGSGNSFMLDPSAGVHPFARQQFARV